MKEFRIESNPDKGNMLAWFVVWFGCDGRIVAWCHRRHEAEGIRDALNTSKTADRWYKRAHIALGMKATERGEPLTKPERTTP